MINIDNKTLLITRDNVKELGEIMAVCAVKFQIRYAGRVLDALYQTLLKDIHKPSTERTISDGYDIAQEAIVFLCEHIGKTLGTVIGKKRNGTNKTVKNACFGILNRYIKYERNRIDLDFCIDDLYAANESTVPFEADPVMSDWTPVDEKIEQMNLKPGELETLNCYLGGLSFGETARELSVAKCTVWNRMRKVQAKYVATFGTYV